jgi:hypothetical protein
MNNIRIPSSIAITGKFQPKTNGPIAIKVTLTRIGTSQDVAVTTVETLPELNDQEAIVRMGDVVARSDNEVTLIARYMSTMFGAQATLIRLQSYREDISNTFYHDFALRSDYLPWTDESMEWRNGTGVATIDIATQTVIAMRYEPEMSDEMSNMGIIVGRTKKTIDVTCMAANGGYNFLHVAN